MVTRDVTSIIVDSALFRLKFDRDSFELAILFFAQRDSVITNFLEFLTDKKEQFQI